MLRAVFTVIKLSVVKNIVTILNSDSWYKTKIIYCNLPTFMYASSLLVIARCLSGVTIIVAMDFYNSFRLRMQMKLLSHSLIGVKNMECHLNFIWETPQTFKIHFLILGTWTALQESFLGHFALLAIR